jgi:hypothetical protein
LRRFWKRWPTEYDDRVQIAKLDVEENQAIAMQYGVRSIPTLMVFKDGQVQAGEDIYGEAAVRGWRSVQRRLRLPALRRDDLEKGENLLLPECSRSRR